MFSKLYQQKLITAFTSHHIHTLKFISIQGAFEIIRKRIEAIIGKHECLINTIRKRKLQWLGHVCRQNDTMAKYILQSKVEGARKQGRPRKNWTSKFWAGRVSLWRKQQESRATGRPGGLWSTIRWCSHDPTGLRNERRSF